MLHHMSSVNLGSKRENKGDLRLDYLEQSHDFTSRNGSKAQLTTNKSNLLGLRTSADYLAMGDNALSDIQSKQSRQASRAASRRVSQRAESRNASPTDKDKLNLDLKGLQKLPPQKGGRHRRYQSQLGSTHQRGIPSMNQSFDFNATMQNGSLQDISRREKDDGKKE